MPRLWITGDTACLGGRLTSGTGLRVENRPLEGLIGEVGLLGCSEKALGIVGDGGRCEASKVLWPDAPV